MKTTRRIGGQAIKLNESKLVTVKIISITLSDSLLQIFGNYMDADGDLGSMGSWNILIRKGATLAQTLPFINAFGSVIPYLPDSEDGNVNLSYLEGKVVTFHQHQVGHTLGAFDIDFAKNDDRYVQEEASHE